MLIMLFEISSEFERMPAMFYVTTLLRTLMLFELSARPSEKFYTALLKDVISI